MAESDIRFFPVGELSSSGSRQHVAWCMPGRIRLQRVWTELVRIAMGMNASGRRKFTAASVLGPSNPEDIVSAVSNGGLTRSSDPHEWRNELGAVSGRDSAKLQYL